MESVRLRDGTEAVIWPLLPVDRDALREEYEHLSPQSRYHRFLSTVPHLTENLLEHLVDDVDGVDHVALVLFAYPVDGTEIPAGIARMVRYPDRPTAIDVAVTVADDWQGRGVATALLQALSRHWPAGVTEIVTEVAADNAASLALLRRLGDVVTTPEAQGRLSVVVQLNDRAAVNDQPRRRRAPTETDSSIISRDSTFDESRRGDSNP